MLLLKRFKTYAFITSLLVLSLAGTGCQHRDKAYVLADTAYEFAKDTVEAQPADTVFTETRLMTERGIVLERARDIFLVIKDYQRSMGGFVMSELLD